MTPALEHPRDDPSAVPLTRRRLLQQAVVAAPLVAMPGMLAACGGGPAPNEEAEPTPASRSPTVTGTATEPATPNVPGAAPPVVSGGIERPATTEDEAASPGAVGTPAAAGTPAATVGAATPVGGRLDPPVLASPVSSGG